MSASIPPPPDRASVPPESRMMSGLMPAYVRPKEQGFFERRGAQAVAFVENLGIIAQLVGRTVRSLLARPLEWRATVYQMEAIGVASVGIASVTAVFIGMVMALQFAYGLQKF